MSVEWFLKLKEIDSLSKMRIKHLKAIGEQEDRLSKLYDKRQSALTQTATLKQEHSSLQQKMFEMEKRLKTAAQQKQRFIDIGDDDHKILSYQQQVDKAEEEGFQLMEETEKNELEQNELKTFGKGLEKTVSEIEAEVNEEKLKNQQAISQLDVRITLLEEELPDDFQSLLKKTMAKNLAVGPFTRIDAGSCFFCRYKISRMDESEIDMLKGLKVCPQCSRIFLPYGA